MKRVTNPGAAYSSALADFSQTTESGVEIKTSEPSTLTAPDGGLLALVTRRFNGFLFIAGQGATAGHAWLWTPTGWQDLGYAHGVRPCAFGTDSLFFSIDGEHYRRVRLDTFEVTDHGMQIGSQGLRYVDGETVYTGDQTIYDGTVHQFIDRGDVRGGQGSDSGYLLVAPMPDGTSLAHDLGYYKDGLFHREGGNCQFCNLERDGDQLAVSIVKFLENQSVFYFLTRAEVDALPLPGQPSAPQPPPKITVASYDALLKSGEPWALEFANDGDGTRFLVTKDAKDRLWIEAQNVAGRDHTGQVRQLTVEGPDSEPDPPEPEPMPLFRFWQQSNIGAPDTEQMFQDASRLTGRNFCFYDQNVMSDTTTAQVGPNIYPNLVAWDVFKKLKDLGVPLCIEMGSVKDWDCTAEKNIGRMQTIVQRVADAGGEVAAFSQDEPLTSGLRHCGLNSVQVADRSANYTRAVRALGSILVGHLEAWPEVPFQDDKTHNDLVTFYARLHALDALPNYFHPDVDWNRAKREGKDAAQFLRDAKAMCDRYGVTFGVFVNSTVDPIDPDKAHHDNLVALGNKIYGIATDPTHPIEIAHVHVASWASRHQGGPQDVPYNLGQYGMLQTFAEVSATFEPTPQPPEPEPEDDMDFVTLISAEKTLAVREIRPSAEQGSSRLILADPGVDDRDPAKPITYNPAVFSVQPPAKGQTLPKEGARGEDQDGDWERARLNGNYAVYTIEGKRYGWPFTLVR